MSPFDHIALYILLYTCAIIYDKVKKTRYSRIFLVIMIFLYVFTEGLRYGRGVDYLGNYGPNYLVCMTPDKINVEFEQAFIWLMQLIHIFDPLIGFLPYGSIFLVYAVFFIVSLLYLNKVFKDETSFFFLLAFLSTLFLTEWTIRQGVSASFIFLGIYCLEKKNWYWVVIWFFIGYQIHHGNVISILIIVLFYFYLNKKPIPWKVSVPVLVFLETLTNFSSIAEKVTLYLQLLDVAMLGNFSVYVEKNSFVGEAELMEEFARGTLTQIITVVFYASLIITGYIAQKRRPYATYLYNAAVIGLIFYDSFRLAGTFSRIFNVLSTLWFIPFAMVLKQYPLNKKNILCKVGIAISFFYLVLFYGRYVFMTPTAKYVWSY